MNILVVEDEIQLSRSICEHLANENFICDPVDNYGDAYLKVASNIYSCIILNVNLQKGNAMGLLDCIQKNNKSNGVIIISESSSVDDKVHILNAGADDYITKPFYVPELVARVSAIIRRKFFGGNNLLTLGKLELDLSLKKVTVNGNDIALTRKEYQLLLFFAANKSGIISKTALAAHVWGVKHIADNSDSIYTHVKNLKKKLNQGGSGFIIQSVYGLGYKIVLED